MKFTYPDGATPIDDISGLKISWIKTQEDLNLVEAENISKATSTHLLKSIRLPQQWFNLPTLQRIHQDMFFDVWDWAGKFRTTQTHPGIKPYQILGALSSLCNDVQFWSNEISELTLLEQAARIHHQLVFIHPFLNGNGRFTRLISDRYLKSWKCPFPRWPIDLNKNGQCRKHYIAALREADVGNYEPLTLYMTEYGARDPTLGDLLNLTFFKQNIQANRLISYLKAHIRRGYSIDEPTENGEYPLIIALTTDLKNVASLLINNGAAIQIKDKSGVSAFELALIHQWFDIAYEIYKKGYPYSGRNQHKNLKVPYDILLQFERQYFFS